MMSKVYTVPTHLNTPQPVLSLGGMSLSASQFLWVLLGVALSYDSWQHLKGVVGQGPFGQFLGLGVALLPFASSLVVAFVRLAGLSLSAWIRRILAYSRRPHQLVWRSIRFAEPQLSWLPTESHTTHTTSAQSQEVRS